MSDLDPSTIDGLATHIGGAAAASTLGATIMAWLRGKEAQKVSTELALLRNDVDRLLRAIERSEKLDERVALLEASVNALHQRLDGKRPRR